MVLYKATGGKSHCMLLNLMSQCLEELIQSGQSQTFFPPQPENYYRGVIRKCSVSALKIECFSFFPFGYALVFHDTACG